MTRNEVARRDKHRHQLQAREDAESSATMAQICRVVGDDRILFLEAIARKIRIRGVAGLGPWHGHFCSASAKVHVTSSTNLNLYSLTFDFHSFFNLSSACLEPS